MVLALEEATARRYRRAVIACDKAARAGVPPGRMRELEARLEETRAALFAAVRAASSEGVLPERERCEMPGCDRPRSKAKQRRWCSAHLKRHERLGRADLVQCARCKGIWTDLEIRSGPRLCMSCWTAQPSRRRRPQVA